MGLVWGASGECVEVESGVGCVEQNLRCSVLLFSVCLLLLFGSFGFLSPDGPGLPGAARQPLTFLAPPRKVSSRRATPGWVVRREKRRSTLQSKVGTKHKPSKTSSTHPKKAHFKLQYPHHADPPQPRRTARPRHARRRPSGAWSSQDFLWLLRGRRQNLRHARRRTKPARAE